MFDQGKKTNSLAHGLKHYFLIWITHKTEIEHWVLFRQCNYCRLNYMKELEMTIVQNRCRFSLFSEELV
ncbi:hypothetical protein NH26_13820 [Flammeovirga pacifica]|uniref:Uncharacterized protein n=1 Tax=Flammeovirga pacifica TaxID=915059 RepID=A0A1S1Z2E6_FLAPC|nr:hypothetical protein NH26_13820 [Flammeovirga pacifica]